MRILTALACTVALALGVPGAQAQSAANAVPVAIAKKLGDTNAGRLLVFAKKAGPDDTPDGDVDTSAFDPTGTAVAARELTDFRPGTVALIGDRTDAFPTSFDDLPPGEYRFQAVLDRDHSYAYSGRGGGDLESTVVTATLPGPVPVLTLDHEVTTRTLVDRLATLPEKRRAMYEANLDALKPVDFTSPVMTDFWGRPTHIQGWVALPPGYGEDDATYPAVYSDGGFGSSLESAKGSAARMRAMMRAGDVPPMIWVFLDHHIASGTHEFADSKNNGPWGTALVDELIPALEKQYRMDARPDGRFLTGHSSGGWSTLWLQVRHPAFFGGTWPTSPDPSDFHDFTNVNLYSDDANFYRGPDGKPLPLIRADGKVVATLEQFGELERVLGAYGGQFASFEWVFSPKCPDGRPCPLFDRATGKVDPDVARYWIDHYDIAHIVKRDWDEIGGDLSGKIHLIVGTADTFYLDGPAHRLQKVLKSLGGTSTFRFLPGKTHFDLFEKDDDRSALMKTIAGEMYAVARPDADRQPANN